MAVPKPTLIPQQFAPDERQREAIEHVHGPMLVIAGAGTGKTTVLTRRIASLVRENVAQPDEILALTYTDNAAHEMRERVQKELRGRDISNMQVETFHAYCNNLLIRNGKKFGVLDDKDIWVYLRRRIRELRLNYFVRAANLSQFLNDLLDFMRRCHDELVGPEKYAEYLRRVEAGELPAPRVCKSKNAGSLSDEETLGRCREISSVFATVEHMLDEENLGTFSHMITRAYALLQADAKLLTQEQQRARFILVDEYQDANFAQVKILRQLAGEEHNVFAVGDPDQAIYRFRGASSAAFALFQNQFPGAKLVALEKNRRSTSPILNCAFALISKNPAISSEAKRQFAYHRSPLVSAREEDAAREGRPLQSNPVDAVLLTAKEVEGSDLINQVQQRQRQARAPWSDFAVLYRLHSHRDLLAAEFAEHGIPFSIENMNVMDTPQARDLFACIGAIVSTQDGASLFRVASFPQFRINPEKLRAAIKALPKEEQNSSLADVLAKIEGGSPVLDVLQQARAEIARTGAKSRAALELVMQLFSLDRSTAPVNAVLDWVGGWERKAITKTGELGELLEYLDYFREADGSIPMPSRDENAVRLITVHSVKGLEFKHVFILRATPPSFPASYKEPLFGLPRDLRNPDSLAEDDGKELFSHEERRLFYVAMTRARDSLIIYARQGKGKDSTPAGFLRDLLKDRILTRWLRKRHARPFQTDMFAESSAVAESPTTQWLKLPPASDLSNRLSATAVQSYEMCPLRFKLEREWGLPREVPAAMQYGAVMHRVLRAYYDSVRFERPYSDEALINLFRSDLADAGIQDRYQHELYEKQGIAQLREFVAASRQGPFPNVAHTEEFFEVRLGKTTVVGRIDRIDRTTDGGITITDYKTGKPQSQEDADESLQLSIYALAAREKWGYRAERLVFYNLEENVAVITTRSELQLREAKLKVENVAENVAAGNFEPKPGFYCSFCSYRNLCPATEKRVYAASQRKKATHN
jgi:superfamily I DNA/RNA helicase/RecB family exonuclease